MSEALRRFCKQGFTAANRTLFVTKMPTITSITASQYCNFKTALPTGLL
jgi:hypothetical protein